MCQSPQSTSASRRITRPYSKLARLCEESAARGGTLTTFAAVAKAIGVTPGRVTQMFGINQDRDGTFIRPETVGRITAAFTDDGVSLKVDWLYQEYHELVTRLTETYHGTHGNRMVTDSNTRAIEWELVEASVLPDLVELRLHPPRPGNEVPNSYYVDVTLLLGTANCDYEPENGQEPRTVSISLREARLAIGSDSHRPLKDSMIGERVSSENFRRVAGGVELVGPAPAGILEGSPIGDHHLAVIAATNSGNDPFAVTVAANRRSFVVVDPQAPCGSQMANGPSDNKNAILNALIYRILKKDESGRAVLARATMAPISREINRES